MVRGSRDSSNLKGGPRFTYGLREKELRIGRDMAGRVSQYAFRGRPVDQYSVNAVATSEVHDRGLVVNAHKYYNWRAR
jgi:hypothetical protein